ncbi:hypothetical protein VNI00_017280 [Paramarasmius palmivorus]|uniref:Protein kinase domain-containing protein n=1 Tax=Paramarasmius palmivorus TaxID=297713 RepID=A0AAW0BAG0_9AGAR
MSKLSRPSINKFQEGHHVVTFDDGEEEGTDFMCDEEPHMLSYPFAPGYLPMRFGDILSSQKCEYEVVRKLGWGGSSSVWLARRRDDRTSYFAVKILTCSASARIRYKEGYELETHKRIRQDSASSHPGRTYCADITDVFLATNHHGVHLCFVFRAHSGSVARLVNEMSGGVGTFRLPIPAIASILRQTILGTSYLHSLGMVHTDIKASNLFITIDKEAQAIDQFLRENPSRTYPPRYEPALSSEPIVTAVTEPLPPLDFTTFEEMGICLGDFGEAVPAEKTAGVSEAMPTILRAPEIVLGHNWGKPVDVWAVGCLETLRNQCQKPFPTLEI